MENIDWSTVWMSSKVTLTVLFGFVALVVLFFFPFLIAKWLGELKEHDIFFKRVEETTARAVLVNGRFDKMIMSYDGFRFRREVIKNDLGADDPDSYWDIVPGKEPGWWMRKLPIVGKLMGGNKWIGPWPFCGIYNYSFTWVSWALVKHGTSSNRANSGAGTSNKGPISHSETLSYILLRDDVYFGEVLALETRAVPITNPTDPNQPKFDAGMPVDVQYLLTISICNPKKALFGAQDWLELVTNQFEALLREFVGKRDYFDLYAKEEAVSTELMDELKRRSEISDWATGYGVMVEKVQIQSVEPGGALADTYRELSTEVWAATQKANAKNVTTKAERYHLEQTVGYIAEDARRIEANKWDKMGGTKLTTYIERGGNSGDLPINLNVGNQPSTPQPNQQTQAQSNTTQPATPAPNTPNTTTP